MRAKNCRVLPLCLVIAVNLLLLPSTRADDASAKPAAGAVPDMAEMMKKWAEMAAPGPAHKKLDAVVGEWEVESKFWMAGPDAPPTVSKGKSTKRWILGGRFVQEEHKGEMMGNPFEGMGFTGYDKMKQKYVGAWMDTSGSCLSTSEGTAEGDVITLNGVMDEPMTGERNKPVKYILRLAGPGKHILEIHDVALGEKSRVGEITYTRKKT